MQEKLKNHTFGRYRDGVFPDSIAPMETSRMKKSVYSAIPFLLMFILATGSVVLSCATAPSAKSASREDKLSINTAANLDGRLYTTWVFGEIRSVMIVDEGDRSRKIELKAEDYRYDPASTEITLLRALPFKNYFASIEGTESLPHTFVLNGIKDEEELMVIISDRLAIAGYDYAFDRSDQTPPGASTLRAVFRSGVAPSHRNGNEKGPVCRYETSPPHNSLFHWLCHGFKL